MQPGSQGEWPGMRMCEQRRLHCTSQWGCWLCALCGHCIQNDWASRATKLHQILHQSPNIPLWKVFRWFRRPQLWATGDWQLHHHSMPAHASHLLQSFLWSIKTPRWLSPSTAQVWHPVTSGFSPKLKSPSKGKRFQIIDEIQEDTTGQKTARQVA